MNKLAFIKRLFELEMQYTYAKLQIDEKIVTIVISN